MNLYSCLYGSSPPPSISTLLHPSLLWLPRPCSTSPFQLRKRLSKAHALIRSVYIPRAPEPPSAPHPEGKNPPQTPFATAPQPPQLPSSPCTQHTTPTPPTPLHVPTLDPSPPHPNDISTDININLSHQALSLLQTSLQTLPSNPALARLLHVHALIYLIRSLPPLSEPETANLRTALPHRLLSAEPPPDTFKPRCSRCSSHAPTTHPTTPLPPPPPPPSLLHRSLSNLVFLLLILVRVLLPYLRILMSTLAFYGQEYRVHERALALSGAVAGKAWGVLAESVEPAWVVWFASEVGKGVGEGWRRGVQREERWYGRGQMMTERAAASEEERETAALNFHR